MMCPEVDTKQHKKARFFMKTSYFFGEKELDYQSFLGRSLLAEGAWNSEIW